MTMDLYILCDRPLASVDEWQGALEELGFDLKLPPTCDVTTAEGALTATWRGEPVVFEFSAFLFHEIEELYPKIEFGAAWPHAYDMYTGSLGGWVGALIAAAAIVHRTGGRVFDPQDGYVLKPDEAVRYAKETEGQLLTFKRSAEH